MKLSQIEFAKNAGISQKMLSHYETGKTNPPIKALIDLAKYCKVSLDYLILGEDPVMTHKTKIADNDLLSLFQKASSMNPDKKNKIKWLLESILLQ